MLSFGSFAGLLALIGLVAGVPVLVEYERTGLVARFPTLFVAVGLWLGALVSLLVGIILERASRDRLERNRLAYLSLEGPAARLRPGFDLTGTSAHVRLSSGATRVPLT
jgi:hypothetical protein